MPTDIVIALITAASAAALAVVTYGLAKKRERDADLRKERLAHYKEFVASLNGILDGEDTPNGHRAFAKACNNLNLVAPQPVIQALQGYQHEIRLSNPNRNLELQGQLLSHLLYEIRKDLGVWPKDSTDFKVGLWASGIRVDEP
jgi:hypothetical protein